MNDFIKDELLQLLEWAEIYTEFGFSWTKELEMPLIEKIQSMIDDYPIDFLNSNEIAASHLKEAAPLISHAMCLLRTK